MLYYFKSRNNVKTLHGIIPLERARVQAGPPPGYLKGSGSSAQTTHSLCITITFHVQHAYVAKYPFYVLLAPTSEVHKAWLDALSSASIPRASLLAKLAETGALSSLHVTCMEEAKICFPTTSSAVIASSACLRLDSQPQELSAAPLSADAAVVVVATASSPPSVYTTPTDKNNSRNCTPPASKVPSVALEPAKTTMTPEGKKALSARSSAQHAQQDQQHDSPSLRNTFCVLTKASPEISTAAA